MSEEAEAPRAKHNYIGAPAIFVLEEACKTLNAAFDGHCYLVGSVLKRPDWRDVDVRLMMDDDAFNALFPHAGGVEHGHWEHDERWIVMTVAISERLSRQTGLPIDFQFQPSSFANVRHKGARHALGMRIYREEK